MAIEVFNRYENKYIMDIHTYVKIQNIINKHMYSDENSKKNSFYTICNIYYDTCNNELIRKSISKPKYKEKLRLRGYGVPSLEDKVYLEIKKKVNGLVNKRRTSLKLKEAYNFIETKKKPKIQDYMNKQVLNEIEYFLNLYCLEPKIYISYDRKAFFCNENRDLRITFDSNITTRRYKLGLNYGNYGMKLLNKNIILMEIKAENNIPIWVSKMLSNHKLYKSSFSKYGTVYKNSLQNPQYEEVSNNA
ncbi:MAG: polyphosphate polymerase domain-containing protein [Clostridiales bacterium]